MARGTIESYFDRLGHTVKQAWSVGGQKEDDFPGVAAKALEALDVPEGLDGPMLLRHLGQTETLPDQMDRAATFGEPPITLFRSQDFFIQAIVWLDGTTTIHEHGFSGAYRVIEGGSIHSRYHFSCDDMVTRRLRFGELVMEEAEVLRVGDVREIAAGPDGAHALFHLERPSVTIVVRTYSDPWAQPQLNYWRPGMALDPSYTPPELDRRLQGLVALHRIDPDAAASMGMDLVGRSGPLEGVLVLDTWRGVEAGERFDDVVDHFARCHPTLAQRVRSVFDERERQKNLALRRRMLPQQRHRLFLGVLLNLPDRASQASILSRLFPGEPPGEILASLVGELAAPEVRGASGVVLSADELQQLQDALRANASGGSTADLSRLSEKVGRVDLLRRLFAD